MDDTYIHATAEVSRDATVGSGCRIWNNAQVREKAVIGTDCIISKDVYIDTGVHVGNKVKIQNAASLYRPLSIGDGVFVGPQVIFANDHAPRAITPDFRIKGEDDWEQQETVVREGASLGAGSIVLPGRTIGEWSMVGAAALVTKDVRPYSLVIGVPARAAGWVCRCASRLPNLPESTCSRCGRRYLIRGDVCREL